MDAAPAEQAFTRLLQVVARLRAPDGCPWDRAQTEATMAPHLLEETCEAIEALRHGDDRHSREELGDVLLNVLMITQIASERGAFTVTNVLETVTEKLIRRHPHVFGDRLARDGDTVLAQWEQIKRLERETGPPAVAMEGHGMPPFPRGRGVLDGLPVSLPALQKAQRAGEKAARVGFDWPDPAGPRAKIDEELAELDQAIRGGDPAAIHSELGDLLFSVVNLARHLKVPAENALQDTIDTFRARFAHVEKALDGNFSESSLEELERLWQQAKNV